MICPVCDREFSTQTDSINFALCEEYGGCRCGYYYEFAYGFTRHEFGPFAVVEGYADSPRRSKWSQRKMSMFVAFWKVAKFGGCITVEAQS